MRTLSRKDVCDLKGPSEIAAMSRAGEITARILALLSRAAVPGASTGDLDSLAREELRKRGAKPAFLGYRGFPAVLCASLNSEVVHGIPSPRRVLAEGDIIGLDFGCIVDGFYADSAVTVGVGRVSRAASRLMSVTRESLFKGIDAMAPDKRIGDISSAVQEHAEAAGYSLVRHFAGHGIGRALHEEPQVPNVGKAGTGPRLAVGMVLAIEPMVCAGSPDVKILEDGWTAATEDGRLSAHFEHTVHLSPEGPRILTRLEDVDG